MEKEQNGEGKNAAGKIALLEFSIKRILL